MKNLNIVDGVSLLLLIVGGANWGSIALFQVDLVSSLFGVMSVTTKIVYGLVAVAAVYMTYSGLMALANSDQQMYANTRTVGL